MHGRVENIIVQADRTFELLVWVFNIISDLVVRFSETPGQSLYCLA